MLYKFGMTLASLCSNLTHTHVHTLTHIHANTATPSPTLTAIPVCVSHPQPHTPHPQVARANAQLLDAGRVGVGRHARGTDQSNAWWVGRASSVHRVSTDLIRY